MGAIVGSRFAVSAAHCFVDIRISRFMGVIEVLRVYIPAEYEKSDGGMAGIHDKAPVTVVVANEDPTKLKYTMTKPIDHETCGVNYLLGEDDSVFCAAVTAANAGSAVCQGDDGTPYVHKSGVVGILSYVPSDRSSDAIFTKVGAYEQFIKRAMTEKIDHTIKVVDYRS